MTVTIKRDTGHIHRIPNVAMFWPVGATGKTLFLVLGNGTRCSLDVNGAHWEATAV